MILVIIVGELFMHKFLSYKTEKHIKIEYIRRGIIGTHAHVPAQAVSDSTTINKSILCFLL